MTRIIPFVCVVLCYALGLHAEIKSDKPADICNYLADQSLQVPKYSKIATDEWFGSVEKKVVEGTTPSNVTYVIEGKAEDQVGQVSLILSVEAGADTEKACAELISLGKILIQRATNAQTPDEVLKAIREIRDGKWTVGNYTVRVDCWKSESSERRSITLLIY